VQARAAEFGFDCFAPLDVEIEAVVH